MMKNNWKIGIVLLAGVALLGLTACGNKKASESKDTKTVGVLQVVEHDSLDAAYTGFKEGLAEAGFKEAVESDGSTRLVCTPGTKPPSESDMIITPAENLSVYPGLLEQSLHLSLVVDRFGAGIARSTLTVEVSHDGEVKGIRHGHVFWSSLLVHHLPSQKLR